MINRTSDAPTAFFSSAREKKLWACTLAVVAAIYATLGVASTLAGLIDNQILAAVVFVGCMLLVGLMVLIQGLRTRPGSMEVGIGVGVAVVYLLLFLRLTIPERSHLIEYGVVAVFIHEALTERASQWHRVPMPPLLAILATSLVGAIDEFIQLFLPSRVFDWIDILFNVLAGVITVVAMMVLRWARSLTGRTARRDARGP